MNCLKRKRKYCFVLLYLFVIILNTFTVAFLSGNFAIKMERFEVHVAAAPTPCKRLAFITNTFSRWRFLSTVKHFSSWNRMGIVIYASWPKLNSYQIVYSFVKRVKKNHSTQLINIEMIKNNSTNVVSCPIQNIFLIKIIWIFIFKFSLNVKS